MKRSTTILLAAGAALATTGSSFAGVFLNSVYSAVHLEYENDGWGFPPFGGEGEHYAVTDSRTSLGMAQAQAGEDPGGVAWSAVGMYDDGMRFMVSQGLSYDSMYPDPAEFDADMRSRISITLDQSMRLDYSFVWSINSAELFNGAFDIYRDFSLHHHCSFSASNPIEGGSIVLEAGYYSFVFNLDGAEASGGVFPDWTSGNSSLVTTMNFSAGPAPGALALLGLAGCAWRRGRRA